MNFRKNDLKDALILQQYIRSVRTAADRLQFIMNAFKGDVVQKVACFLQAPGGVFFDGETQLGSEANGTQDTQGIFCKALGRIVDGTDDVIMKIIEAVEKIHQAELRMVAQGVDREVAAGTVVLQTAGEGDMIGVAVIFVCGFGAVGGDFQHLAFAEDDADGSVLET